MSFFRNSISRGHKYRQLVENKWDPIKKQSRTHIIKHVGTIIEKDGKEILKPSPLKIDTVDKAYPIGKLAVYWKLAQDFKIYDSIAKSFRSEGEDIATGILILTLNQLIGRKALTKLDSWVMNSPLHRWINLSQKRLTKDYFLSALDNISQDIDSVIYSYSNSIQNNLTNTWRKIIGTEPKRYLFFQDITRIRWNGNTNYFAENGHGIQNGRPHIGFNLIVSKDNYMPIIGYPVRGAHHDTTTIKETIGNLNKLNIKKITMVWDRGFVSEQNIQLAIDNKMHILSAGVRTNDDVMDWISKYSDSEIEQRENIMRMSKDKGIYYKEEIGKLYGQECKIVVTLDPPKRNHCRIERDLLLHTLEHETSKKKIARIKNNLELLVVPTKGRRGYKIDNKVEELARNCDGRSLFFCTDMKMSGEEIVKTYFQKDYIEKAFRFLRGNACLTPVRYQLPGRIEAYLSVVNFIAYELIAAVLWKLKVNKFDISFEELMEEAEKIYEVEMTSKGKKIYRWTYMSKDVEKLFKPYNIIDLQT
jgi:transposase